MRLIAFYQNVERACCRKIVSRKASPIFLQPIFQPIVCFLMRAIVYTWNNNFGPFDRYHQQKSCENKQLEYHFSSLKLDKYLLNEFFRSFNIRVDISMRSRMDFQRINSSPADCIASKFNCFISTHDKKSALVMLGNVRLMLF